MGLITAATVMAVSTVASAGMSYYQAEEQKKAAEDARRKADAESTRQQAEADRIARETRPEGETVGEAIKFGTMSNETDATSDFLVKKPKKAVSGLSTNGQTGGLGFVL